MKDKKNIVITYIATAAIFFVILVLFIRMRATDILRYNEGWNTFFYESSFVTERINSFSGLGELARCFFLQFFATEWMGEIVLSFTFTQVLIIILIVTRMALAQMVKKENALLFLTPIVGCIITFYITLVSIGNMGKTGITPLLTRKSQDVKYMKLCNLIRDEKWDEVITICKEDSPVNNLLLQNCLNMALAEKGMLGKSLFDEPCIDIRSIYVNDIQSEKIAALLSDIYFSMGHIAQSQRYAFEANEKMGNLSPRLLQRLVVTNIIYGQYGVADKYLWWLEKTACYANWCKHYRQFIRNDEAVEADVMLGTKRKCLIEDNRFSGIRGLDDDLLHIARATRGTSQCRTTLNYLGSLYILAGYDDKFMEMMDEFRDSEDMPAWGERE